MTDVITLDSDDETMPTEPVISSRSHGMPPNISVEITAEKPLELAKYLNFGSLEVPPPIEEKRTRTPSTSTTAAAVPQPSRTPFTSKNGHRVVATTNTRSAALPAQGRNGPSIFNGNSKGRAAATNHTNSGITDRKRAMVMEQSVRFAHNGDKRPRLTINGGKKDTHGSISYIVSDPGHCTQDEEFSGQFRCTAFNCNKVLPNNISFMYHLWAHVGYFTFKPPVTDNDEAMTDDKWTRMCTVCLTIFETPFERTRHYLEVHQNRLATNRLCHMCEIVDNDGSHINRIQHRITELPYDCRKCKFRSSSRMALIDHFAKVHVSTTLLICPFCPFSHNISVSEKQKSVVFAKPYVLHVTGHGSIVAKRCSCCSYKFTEDDRFGRHLKCHTDDAHKVQPVSRLFKDLKEKAVKTKPRHEMLALMRCIECNSQFPKAEDHFGETKKCEECSFQSNCMKAYWKHVHLSDCNPENRGKFEFAITPDSNFVKPKCDKKTKKKLTVCKSPDYIQNFRMFRNFLYDRTPSKLPLPPPKSEVDIIRERREQLRQMTTTRRLQDLGPVLIDEICESLYGTRNGESDAVEVVKSLRIPFIEYFARYLEEKHQEESDEGMSDVGEEEIKMGKNELPKENGEVIVEKLKYEPKEEVVTGLTPSDKDIIMEPINNEKPAGKIPKEEPMKEEIKLDNSDEKIIEDDEMEVEILDVIETSQTREASEDMTIQGSENDMPMDQFAIEA